MVLDYVGQPVRYSHLLRLLGVTPDLGAPASNVTRLSALDISVEYGSGTMDDLANMQSLPCDEVIDVVGKVLLYF